MRRRKKVMPLKESTFKKAYNRFFEDKKAENLSDETLKTYRLHIDNYLNCLAYWDMPTEVSDREDWNWWM